ncbi:nicotinamide riboside kinase 1 [Osmerus mordax]|uniref:nicotinamide riboside kinase 1 n=1 Tax=Osmerus mordax TaxID=8014 RepID=UPI0035103350
MQKSLVVGIGGTTNGGKSTLSQSLQQRIPNSCIIAQDTFFKDDSMVPVDSNGFKQYDTLNAINMDLMMREVELWRTDPGVYLTSRGTGPPPETPDQEKVYVLIVEGFLIFNHRPLNELMDMRYFLEIPFEVCRERRCSRVYNPPDPPGYFDGHVWPMYLKNKQEMEDTVSGIVVLDGLKLKEDLLASVCEAITREMQSLVG